MLVSRLHVATAPPQHQIPGRFACAQVPWPVGSSVLGHRNALPGDSQSLSQKVSRSHDSTGGGPASGFAHASASVRLHARHEPTPEPQRTQRSLGPQFSSLRQPGWHFASKGVLLLSQTVPAEQEMGAFFGKPGGASAWHSDFPVRLATVQEPTSPLDPLDPLDPLGVSFVLLPQATWQERASARAMLMRVIFGSSSSRAVRAVQPRYGAKTGSRPGCRKRKTTSMDPDRSVLPWGRAAGASHRETGEKRARGAWYGRCV
jgi:hypothetical protein